MLLRADTHITRLLDYKLCEELLPSINPTMTNDNINIAFGECDGKGCGKERKEGETGGEMGKKSAKSECQGKEEIVSHVNATRV